MDDRCVLEIKMDEFVIYWMWVIGSKGKGNALRDSRNSDLGY